MRGGPCPAPARELPLNLCRRDERCDRERRVRRVRAELARGLPFGLDLEKGITIAVDEGQQGASLRFRTCLPQGCMASLSFAADVTDALRRADAIHHIAQGICERTGPGVRARPVTGNPRGCW